MRLLLAIPALVLLACAGVSELGHDFDDDHVWGRLEQADVSALAACDLSHWHRPPHVRDRLVSGRILELARIVPACGIGRIGRCEADVLNRLHPAPPNAPFGRPVAPGFLVINGACSDWLKARTQE